MIIAILGYKGSGKSTVAAHIQDYDFIRRPIASPLKEMLKTMGLTDAQVYGNEKEKPCHLLGGQTPRYAMQTLGTEWGRRLIHGDIWIRSWAATVPFDRDVVVDDLRFPNEALHLLGLRAHFVKVERSLVRPSEDETLHESEVYVDKIPVDHVFSNEGSLESLKQQVSNWMVDMPLVMHGSGTDRSERFRKALHALSV